MLGGWVLYLHQLSVGSAEYSCFYIPTHYQLEKTKNKNLQETKNVLRRLKMKSFVLRLISLNNLICHAFFRPFFLRYSQFFLIDKRLARRETFRIGLEGAVPGPSGLHERADARPKRQREVSRGRGFGPLGAYIREENPSYRIRELLY